MARVATVGAGPAGAFAASALRRSRGEVEIDLYARLPTAWGLLRGGVAPDHQEIKRLDDRFERETLARGCRFLGNVEVGTDVARRAYEHTSGSSGRPFQSHGAERPERGSCAERVRSPGTHSQISSNDGEQIPHTPRRRTPYLVQRI